MSTDPIGGWATVYRVGSSPFRMVASWFTGDNWLRLLITGVFGFALVMIWTVTKGVDFKSLGEPTEARGLITYTIAVGTIALAFSLVIRSLFGNDKAGDESFEKHFQHAREVMGVFAGILGTIVGFYFGATRATPEKVTIAPPQILATGTDGTVTIASHVTGGTAPYRFRVARPGLKEPLLEGLVSRDGWITLKLKKTDVEGAVLTVSDARERSDEAQLRDAAGVSPTASPAPAKEP